MLFGRFHTSRSKRFFFHCLLLTSHLLFYEKRKLNLRITYNRQDSNATTANYVKYSGFSGGNYSFENYEYLEYVESSDEVNNSQVGTIPFSDRFICF